MSLEVKKDKFKAPILSLKNSAGPSENKTTLAKKSLFKKRKINNSQKVNKRKKEDDISAAVEPDYSELEYKNHGVSAIEKAKLLAKRRGRNHGLLINNSDEDKYKSLEGKDYTNKQTWRDKGGLMSSDRAMLFLDDEDRDVNLRHLNSTFAKETKNNDQETAMKEFIDKEVARRKGYLDEYEKREEEKDVASLKALEDRQLYKMEDKFENIPRTYNPHQLGEIGHNVLEGIPEVNLGTEYRIDNIDKTMATVKKLQEIDEELRKKVVRAPSNYTANYLLHNKYMGEILTESDTNRYIDVKVDMSLYSGKKYDVCNDGSRR